MRPRAWIVQDGGAKPADRDAAAAIGNAVFAWIHLHGAAPDTRTFLEQQHLDGLVVDAMMALETRPRAEAFPDGELLNLRGLDAREDDNVDLLASIRLWVERNRVISVTMRDLQAIGPLEEAVAAGRVRDGGDLVATLAGAITAGLDPDVAELGDKLDDCEEHLDAPAALTMRRTIAQVRATAIAYRRFMAPQRQALEKLVSGEATWLEPDDRQHIAAAADRAARMVEELEAIRERAALMHEQLTDLRAEQLDTRGLLISIVALIFLPLTFLTGLLGMNVDGIPFAHEPWAFWGVVAICTVIALGVAGYLAVARWFR